MENIFMGHDLLKTCNQNITNALLINNYLTADQNSETKKILFS